MPHRNPLQRWSFPSEAITSQQEAPILISTGWALFFSLVVLPMYSGKPAICLRGYHPCHGLYTGILPQFDRNFNQILFLWNMRKVSKNESQNNLTKEKRLKGTDFSHLPVQMSVTRTSHKNFINNSQMLIFPAFRAHPFRKMLPFSHRFKNF